MQAQHSKLKLRTIFPPRFPTHSLSQVYCRDCLLIILLEACNRYRAPDFKVIIVLNLNNFLSICSNIRSQFATISEVNPLRLGTGHLPPLIVDILYLLPSPFHLQSLPYRCCTVLTADITGLEITICFHAPPALRWPAGNVPWKWRAYNALLVSGSNELDPYSPPLISLLTALEATPNLQVILAGCTA